MKGQLDFHGREIQAVYVDIPGLGEIPLDDVWPHEEELQQEDHIELTVRGHILFENNGAKADSDGISTGELKRVYKVRLLKPGLAIRARLSKAERDAAWDREHGATA
jgi:hypothetical protein